MVARNLPSAIDPIVISPSRPVPPNKYVSVGFTISVENDVVTLETAPPKTKPIARPTTPRSRTKSMNPTTCPLSWSRTMHHLYQFYMRSSIASFTSASASLFFSRGICVKWILEKCATRRLCTFIYCGQSVSSLI